MPSGTIIFLNGSSSSGKTTVAVMLQELLAEPFYHVGLDQFRDGMPAKYRGLNSPKGSTGQRGLNVVPINSEDQPPFTSIQFGDQGILMLRGMRPAMAAMAKEGPNLIIDDIILEQSFLEDYLQAMEDISLYFVGVRCPAEVISEREAMRPGRFPGTAVGHMEICHAHGDYDVEIDTSSNSPEQCAKNIIRRLEGGPPEAFAKLRRQAIAATPR